MVTIVLGPVRSGKSARAAELAHASGKRVVVAATAAIDPNDAEMRARVERHRRDRPPEWTVVETAQDTPLARVVKEAPSDACVLIDALGTWLAALLLTCPGLDELHGAPFEAVRSAEDLLAASDAELVDAVSAASADVVIVAEETGWGLVPPTALGRVFRDALGRLTRRLAASADRVELIVAGYAVDLARIGTRIATHEESRR
jgi:adenosylcobinamide kinase/adenosylcobinamide-phosphate guanylyltransferase